MNLIHRPGNPESIRLRFADVHVQSTKDLAVHDVSDTKFSRRSWFDVTFQSYDLDSMPCLGWLFVYIFVLFFFSTSRCLALSALLEMYGSPKDNTVVVKALALSLGFLEDVVCATCFATVLWLFDTLRYSLTKCFWTPNGVAVGMVTVMRAIGVAATFVVSWLLCFAVMAPYFADLFLVVCQHMRFSFGLWTTLLRERDHLKAAPISTQEVYAAYGTAGFLIAITTLFALVRALHKWADLSIWNPTQLLQVSVSWLNMKVSVKTSPEVVAGGLKFEAVCLEEGFTDSTTASKTSKKGLSSRDGNMQRRLKYNPLLQASGVFVGLVILPSMAIVLSSVCSPLVAYAALNATLNEMFGHAFQPSLKYVEPPNAGGQHPWTDKYIDTSEIRELFGNKTLYRRTLGFRGDLAFNVSIDLANPPNVLIIGVESFRFRDSHYLVGEEDPSDLYRGTNMTITPNFDKWARRGVALRNVWSSYPTSRSLESMLFAQVPYQSNVKTGITGGRNTTKLSGVPQLFAEKGYETYFTTGASIALDDWSVFLPSHGFNTVWDVDKIYALAKKTIGLRPGDRYGPMHRGFYWGFHDDISFKLVGDLLVKKNREQRERLARGEPKKPLFLTHYTISSHGPFTSWPRWYEDVDKPDFTQLYEGEKHADRIGNYMKVRYFTDMELGKFMDRMETGGVLNDTIVVIMGDHGQGPESDFGNSIEESMTRVPAAIIAEGRLGDDVGTVIDDAAEHYDLLNTLADITGLPGGGLEQTGVGRSLKRKIPFGERVVYSNDPLRKMAVVRGHQRLRYDEVTEVMMLHDTETDYHMTTDLLPGLTPQEQAEWRNLRDDGRHIAAYYKKRWDENCLLAVDCIP
uniref:Sulfatase N-terminal domain-containing protein n=1 Tax=Peronospora matthiolae TaxID=2874970 RepID=A0AAV1TCZ7_9STRA